MDVAFGKGKFLAGSTNGVIYESYDGFHWSYSSPVGSTKTVMRVFFTQNAFWALAGSSLFQSSDGKQWTAHPTGAGVDLIGFAAGDGRMVVISGSSALVSSNGTDWVVSATMQNNQILTGLAFGKGTFVVSRITLTGKNQPNSGSMLMSSNGMDWVETILPLPSTLPGSNGSAINDVVFDGARFVAVGDYQNEPTISITRYPMWARSDDGKNWLVSRFPEAGSFAGSSFNTINCVGDRNFAFENYEWYSSRDGEHWKLSGQDSLPQGRTAYGRGVLVGVSGGNVFTTTDLEHFSSFLAPVGAFGGASVGGFGFGLASGNGMALAIDRDLMLASTNGFVWENRSKPEGFTEGKLAFENGRFLLFNDGFSSQNVTVSTNGSDWQMYGGLASGTRDVAFGDGTYVFVGWAGAIKTTKNFTLWFTRQSGVGSALSSVAWGNGVFIAVGDPSMGSFALVSDNSSDWAYRSLQFEGGVESIAFGNGLFVAVGASGRILTTVDGQDWNSRSSGTTSSLSKVIYDGARFIAVGTGGTALHSTDGIVWNDNISGSADLDFFQVASIGGTALANASIAGSVQLLQSATVEGGKAPQIVFQPKSHEAEIGGVVEFVVGSYGSFPISYSWLSNSIPIADQTNSIFCLEHVTPDCAAQYSVVVSNALGVVTSLAANLTVVPFAGYPTRLNPRSDMVGMSIEFVGAVGVGYDIQSTITVDIPGSWTTITNVILTSPWFSFAPDGTNIGERYFRTVVGH